MLRRFRNVSKETICDLRARSSRLSWPKILSQVCELSSVASLSNRRPCVYSGIDGGRNGSSV